MKSIHFTDLVKAFPAIHFKCISDENLVDYLCANRLSLIRWGDGETVTANGGSIHFQSADSRLKTELRQIVESYSGMNYILGVPSRFLSTSIFRLSLREIRIWYKTRAFFSKRIKKDIPYCSSLIFRDGLISKTLSPETVVRKLIKGKKLLIVVSGNPIDLRSYAGPQMKSEFIGVRRKDAYSDIDSICSSVRDSIRQNTESSSEAIVFLSCGPAAKAVVFRLSQSGIQCIDVGTLFDSAMFISKKISR